MEKIKSRFSEQFSTLLYREKKAQVPVTFQPASMDKRKSGCSICFSTHLHEEREAPVIWTLLNPSQSKKEEWVSTRLELWRKGRAGPLKILNLSLWRKERAGPIDTSQLVSSEKGKLGPSEYLSIWPYGKEKCRCSEQHTTRFYWDRENQVL